MINTRNGSLKGTTVVSDLIAYLNEHKAFYGDTEVIFSIHGDSDTKLQFNHYKDAITIDVTENIDEGDEY